MRRVGSGWLHGRDGLQLQPEEATEEDGTCEYAAEYFNCDGTCISDTDEDGVCDELEVDGCTDATACNYSAEATEDDGTCEYAEAYS